VDTITCPGSTHRSICNLSPGGFCSWICNLSLILTAAISLLSGSQTVYGATARIAILGDRTGGADQAVFEQVIDEINRLCPDAVINVGDLIEGPQPDAASIHKEWDTVMDTMERLRCPVFYVPGNNDIFDEKSRRIYPERTGFQTEYSFDFQGIHCVVIDNSEMTGWDEMSPERMQWLERTLKEADSESLTVVFFHKPFWIDNFSEERPDRLHPLFVKYGVDRVFSGHYHHYTATEKEGVRYVMVGSSGGSIGDNAYRGEFYHYGWLTVRDMDTKFASLRTGHVLAEQWLTLEHRMAQDDLEKSLFSLQRPLMKESTEQCAVTLRINDGCAASRGVYKWNTDNTEWMISPADGEFDVSENDQIFKFAALKRGSQYPLPRLHVSTELQARDFEMSRTLSPTRYVTAGYSEEPITCDGVLNEAVWEDGSVAVLDDFGGRDGGAAGTDPVVVRLVQSNVNSGDRLAIGITAAGPQATEKAEDSTENAWTDNVKRDGPVFMDDCVYLFFWTGNDNRQIIQVVVNEHGGLLDQRGRFEKDTSGRPDMDSTWNADIDYAVQRVDSHWCAELLIPFGDLGVSSRDRCFRVNALRYQPGRKGMSVWVVPATFDPKDAGRIELSGLDNQSTKRGLQ